MANTNNKARSINIFLLDGDPDGIRMAQITMSTIQAIAFRRSQFSRVKKEFKEITRPGVYLLLGSSLDDPDSKVAYIGESEDVAKRLNFHNTNEKTKDKLDFWTDTIALISKDENLTKSHARYIEAKLIALAGENKRWALINGQKPSETGKLPKPDQAAMDEFIDQSKMLTGALGWDLFKSITSQSPGEQSAGESAEPDLAVSPNFKFSGSGFSATATVSRTTGEWIIKKNSKAHATEKPTLSKGASKVRNQLRTDQILAAKADGLVFTTDCKFTSPSTAAAVICGYSINGRIAWKLDNGKTYAEWDAEQNATVEGDISNDNLSSCSDEIVADNAEL
jgi:predicted GIY-YIG superfamily endonuclease